MHDIRFIRDNPDAFDAGLKKRHLAPLSAELSPPEEKQAEGGEFPPPAPLPPPAAMRWKVLRHMRL